MRHALSKAERKTLDELDPVFRAAVVSLLELVQARADTALWHVRIVSGTRTSQEQAARWAIGRTAPGNIVTDARPGESAHEYGLAVDLALIDDQKRQYLPDDAPQWRWLGALARGCGMHWGITLKNGSPDLGHIEALDWRDRRPAA